MKPTIKWDGECNEWTATAPDGYRFEEGLHEIIEAASACSGPIPREWKRQAKRDLDERIAEMPLEPCTDPDCEWCNNV